jgi:hypothetical protein
MNTPEQKFKQSGAEEEPEIIGYRVTGEMAPDIEVLLTSKPEHYAVADPLILLADHRLQMSAQRHENAELGKERDVLKARGGLLDAITGKIRECRECHSTALTWDTHYKNGSGVPEGRLRTNEVTCLFVLGCDECSETLAVVRAEAIADLFNTIIQPTADLEPSSAG